MRSVTRSRLGSLAVNCRLTRSGCLAAARSGRVVRTRRVRRAPWIPAFRISLAVWSRPMSIPARLAAFDSFLRPYTRYFSCQRATSLGVSSASRTPVRMARGSQLRNTCPQPPATPHRWLDSEPPAVHDPVHVLIDERDYLRCWRSSSAPKKTVARFDLIRPTQLTHLLLKLLDSRGLAARLPGSQALIEVSLLDPGPDRLDPNPSCCATRLTAPCDIPVSARNDRTIRTAAAFSPAEYRRVVGFPDTCSLNMTPSLFPRPESLQAPQDGSPELSIQMLGEPDREGNSCQRRIRLA